mmetsp:Transcript_2097/g.4526  ORF Transcript_2097/g.4526 Transcript_2097/m.4526 type:complete len:275 (+) Transcript_2097:155-979(+)
MRRWQPQQHAQGWGRWRRRRSVDQTALRSLGGGEAGPQDGHQRGTEAAQVGTPVGRARTGVVASSETRDSSHPAAGSIPRHLCDERLLMLCCVAQKGPQRHCSVAFRCGSRRPQFRFHHISCRYHAVDLALSDRGLPDARVRDAHGDRQPRRAWRQGRRGEAEAPPHARTGARTGPFGVPHAPAGGSSRLDLHAAPPRTIPLAPPARRRVLHCAHHGVGRAGRGRKLRRKLDHFCGGAGHEPLLHVSAVPRPGPRPPRTPPLIEGRTCAAACAV